MTRVATSLAKPISWVTTTMVIFSFAKSLITFNTSPTISGSSADVGSSKSMTSGFIHRARTMAIRCFCPPDNWFGYALHRSAKPTLSRSAIAWFFASSSLRP